ncbi:RCC1 domain-containing protein [Kutzneria sp. CA-103260]|uniref:RCC1 domain-containing protein n=1 Tax=Kutzneria sp. CA-103260 TaxID=2802641 RepID=UPI001BAD31D8|nr:hypothetical protein [Kutzneria sp. CA-103260]QUQ69837.1 Regulator of chromosome condensation (RCC1) repeat protein [Kutzneria sp. CA-103260]
MVSGRIAALAAGVALAAVAAGAVPAQAQTQRWSGQAAPVGGPQFGVQPTPPGTGFSHGLTPHNGPGVPNVGGTASGSLFTPVTPTRVLDTRDGTGRNGTVAPVHEGTTVGLDLSGVIPAGTTAVVFNLTATNVTDNTNVTAWPQDAVMPTTSNLNVVPGQTRPNLVTVAVNATRIVNFANHTGDVDLIADLAGYYTVGAGAGYTSQSPSRVLDTRDGTGQNGTAAPVGNNATITLDLSAVLPSSATAVVFNLTGTNVTNNTNVTAWPDGQPQPSASNLNLAPGQTAPNLVTVAVGANRKVDLSNHTGSVDLIADLAGYYATGSGNPFYSLTPVRAFDSRNGDPLGPNSSGAVPFTPWIPAGASAMVYNLTGTDASTATNVTAWPDGQPQPSASNLNLAAGETAPNLAITALGTGGAIRFYNHAGSVNLIMDIAGYFAPAPPACTASCVYAAGFNTTGQLANGTIGGTATSNYAQVPNFPRIAAVTGNDYNGFALRANGDVWAWGDNRYGGLGNTNGGGYGAAVVPAPVAALDGGVKAIAAAEFSAYALRTDGSVWAWGDNSVGEAGYDAAGGSTIQATPKAVPGLLSGVTAIAAAAGTGYALKSDGTVWSWGYNRNGELGAGRSDTFFPTATPIPGLTGVVSIGAGVSNGYAVKSDGTVWAWGSNLFGGLGTTAVHAGNQTDVSTTPVLVQGLSNIKSVGSGESDTGYAVDGNGNLFAWGSNYYGTYGNGTSGSYSTAAVQVPGLTNVTAVAPGIMAGTTVIADGKAYVWGGVQATSPTALPGAPGATVVGAGTYATYAIVPTP